MGRGSCGTASSRCAGRAGWRIAVHPRQGRGETDMALEFQVHQVDAERAVIRDRMNRYGGPVRERERRLAAHGDAPVLQIALEPGRGAEAVDRFPERQRSGIVQADPLTLPPGHELGHQRDPHARLLPQSRHHLGQRRVLEVQPDHRRTGEQDAFNPLQERPGAGANFHVTRGLGRLEGWNGPAPEPEKGARCGFAVGVAGCAKLLDQRLWIRRRGRGRGLSRELQRQQ